MAEDIKKKTIGPTSFISMNEFVKDPEFVIDTSNEFVSYGVDNLLPNQLINYYRTVGIHRAIIDKKKKLFLGKGIGIDYTDDRTAKKSIKFLNSINRFENADEVFDKISTDIMLFGGVYLQIIWEKGGKRIKEVFHMPYEQMRSGKKNKFGQVDEYYYNTSEDKNYQWRAYTSIRDKNIEVFPTFNTKSNKGSSQIMYIHEYEPGFNYYSLPDYIGALRDLNTLSAISDFHNSNIHNNMQPGLMFFFTGPAPSEEAKGAIVKSLKTKYGDTLNAGRPQIFWLEQDQEIRVEQGEASNVSDMYELLSADTKENIIVSHQIPRAVSGLMSPGSLGNTKEMIEGIEIIRKNYIEPIQEQFLASFNKIMQINNLNEVELTAPTPNLLQYSLSELSTVLSPNEIREYLGKDPLVEEAQVEDVEGEVIDETVTEKIKE
jgi:hypothetical protein